MENTNNANIYECDSEHSCAKLNKCNKYCEQKLGELLIGLLKNIDTMKSGIGETVVEPRTLTTDEARLVTFGCMCESSDPKNVIKSLIDEAKFGEVDFSKYTKFTDEAVNAISAYLRDKVMEPEEKQAIIDKFNSINEVGRLPMTIKPGTKVLVKYTDSNGNEKHMVTSVKLVKFEIDAKTKRLNGFIYCDVGRTSSNKTYEVCKLEEYGIKWTMPSAEMGIKTAELAYEMVRMNNYGFVKPVEVSNKTNTFAMDAKNVYLVSNDRKSVTVIGTVVSNNIVYMDKIEDKYTGDSAFDKINLAFKFMNKHKRIIAPYGSVEANVVNA